MTEPVYRVKPLVWVDHAGYSTAKTPLGTFTVNDDRHFPAGVSLAAAKAACEADYRERVLRCLIPVVPEPDGEPLPVDREWLLGLGGEVNASEAVVFKGNHNDVHVGNTVRVIGEAIGFVNWTHMMTRPRFLALLVGLGIPHKEIA